MKLNAPNKNLEKKIASILDIDDSIRFVGLLGNDGILLSHYIRKGMVPLLDTEESKKSYRHVVLRAASYKSMNKKLGRILWNIELREKVKWMSLYLKNGNIIIISLRRIYKEFALRLASFTLRR